MTLRVAIVDDEPLALSLLSAILEDIDDVSVVAKCRNGQQAVEAVLSHAPDVLFLDIQMPEMSGFDVIAEIQSDIMPLVIFTTAYAEYAVDAFKVQALDYILKPLDDQAVANSLMRARALLSVGQSADTKPNLLQALHGISERLSETAPQSPRTLVVKATDRVAFLDEGDIDWLEAAGDYVCVHSDGKTRIVRATLKSMELDLASNRFQRIHRSTIVNIDKVSELIPAQKGEAFVLMNDGKRLKVSRSHSANLKVQLLS